MSYFDIDKADIAAYGEKLPEDPSDIGLEMMGEFYLNASMDRIRFMVGQTILRKEVAVFRLLQTARELRDS